MSAQELLERLAPLAEPGAILDVPGAICRYADLPSEALAARSQRGLSDGELERRARAAAADPSVFDEPGKGLYFFPGTICTSNLIECYGLQMRRSSLERFAREAETGRVLHIQHERDDSPLGRSISGTFVDARGRGYQSTIADFYITRGLKLVLRSGRGGFLSFAASPREVLTDTYVDLIRAGHYPDLSVGFDPERVICSIDGLDMRPRLRDVDEEARCPHLPGYDYYRVDAQTGRKTKELVRAIGLIEDAALMETSVVDDGAAPGATIGATAGLFQLKAQLLAEAGELPPEERAWFERRFRCRLHAHDRLWAGFSPIRQTAAQLEALAEPIARKVLGAIGFDLGQEPSADVTENFDGSEEATTDEGPEGPSEVGLRIAVQTTAVPARAPAEQEVSMPSEEQQGSTQDTGAGATQMAQATATLSVATPEQIAELQRQLDDANKRNADALTRIGAMERDARRKRFDALVRDTAHAERGRWLGEVDQHLAHLEALAELPVEQGGGEDGALARHYVELNRRYASALAATQFTRTLGSDASGSLDVTQKVKAEADRLRQTTPSLTQAQAEAEAWKAHPEWMEEYQTERGLPGAASNGR